MKTIRPLLRAFGAALGCAALVGPAPLPANEFASYPIGDDVTPSLGQFQIILDGAWTKTFDAIMATSPFSNTAATRKLKIYRHGGIFTSPVLYDPSTVIGRSESFRTTDPRDSFGVLAGAAPGSTFIKENQLIDFPTWINDPAGAHEIHTFLKSMRLVDSFTTRAGFSVRAGMDAPSRPVSAGQVVAGSATSDFPARSFFNVYVIVDFPKAGVLPAIQLVNTEPLLVQHTNVLSFPPRVIYQHDNSTAVSMYFNNDVTIPDPKGGTDIHVSRGTLFGQLTLAGHGVGTGSAAEVEALQVETESESETGKGKMPINPTPIPRVEIQDYSPDYHQALPTIEKSHLQSNGTFAFTATHVFSGLTHLVQSRANLAQGDWATIATIIPNTNRFDYVDPEPRGSQPRFYRLLVKP